VHDDNGLWADPDELALRPSPKPHRRRRRPFRTYRAAHLPGGRRHDLQPLLIGLAGLILLVAIESGIGIGLAWLATRGP
jgi:hypothetical protein